MALATGRAEVSARLRAICLASPESREIAMKRGPSYRVAEKIFALERAHGAGLALWCKVPEGMQGVLVGAEPGKVFVPPYFGAKGWIGVALGDGGDWREIEAFVIGSYRLVARRRLAGRGA